MSKEYPCVHWGNGMCKYFSDDEVKSYCVEGPCDVSTPSNGDCLRAMSDDDLAECLFSNVDGARWCSGYSYLKDRCREIQCKDCFAEWLKKPREKA